MHRMPHRSLLPLALALAFVAGCSDTATAPPRLSPTDRTAEMAPPPDDVVAPYNEVVSMEQQARRLAALVDPATVYGGTYAARYSLISSTVSTLLTAEEAAVYVMQPPTCTGGYYSYCVTNCYNLTEEFRDAQLDFLYGQNDYWQYTVTGRHYLTPRPIQEMRAALAKMKAIYAKYQQNNCRTYLYG